ncbi:MAG: N-acetylmuramoyl-L-alanine amidase, partial [Actinomycetia bacterium]|nr:N-acetylmuramoyl-L-alanine amidase [Actinomycetes bacterium]
HGDLDDIAAYMRRLQTVRPDLGPEVPYSFVVFAGDGPLDVVVCEGRGRGRTGAHTAGHNSTSYGVAYAGNTEDEPVTAGMEEGVRWVGRTMLDDPEGARPTAGHWQSKATACQGRNGKAVQDRQQPPFTTGLVGEEPDMAQLDRIEAKLDRLVAHWENPVAPAPLVEHSPAWFFRRWHHLFTKEGVVTKCDQQADGAVLEVGKVADAVVDRLKKWLLR